MKSIDKLKTDSILEMLGLEKKTSMPVSIFQSLGVLGLGLAAGIGLGLILAPQDGRQLRDDLSRRIKRSAGRAMNRANDLLESTQMAGA
jgi:gas vesicle protein